MRLDPSTSAWATSVFRLTPVALTSAGIDPTLAMEFGAGMANSTNTFQMGLAFYNDNTVDAFKVRRYIDPNSDGNCADAVLGALPPAAPTITTPTEGSVTSDNTPNITGTCETGATVTIREGATTLCTATCAASAYTCTSSTLTNGLHSITATQVDLAGNTSLSSAIRKFTVDTVANAPTIVTPTEGSVTSDTTPSITGVCETGATVTIREGATTLCTATCAASAYTCTSSALTDGLHSITATQEDLAGNISVASPVRNFTVNTAAPSAPTIELPADGSSGVDATPTVSGTCQTGTLVTVSEGAQVLCTASCIAEAYACEASELAVGAHTLTAIQTDDLNQDSPASAPVDYTVVADSDEDGLSDEEETDAGTDPNDADSDDDGVIDGDEPAWNVDSDGDGLMNALDADSDNDGLFDGTELGLGCGLPATDPVTGACIADADAGATTTNPLDADTDDGGVSDGAEDANHDGAIDLGETDPNVGADDVGIVDTDGDGLSDAEEDFLGTDPLDRDSDDDGTPDGQEANPGQDSDGDGLINGLDPDSDNDGLADGTEQGLGCDDPDTDAAAGQCVADVDPATTTSPLNPDTDGGGVSDGDEDTNGDGAVDPGERDPNDPSDDGDEPAVDEDRDGDGVVDGDDNCPDVANADQANQDGDGLGDVCDDDADGNGFVDNGQVAGGKLGCSAAQAPTGHLVGLVILALAALRRRRKA